MITRGAVRRQCDGPVYVAWLDGEANRRTRANFVNPPSLNLYSYIGNNPTTTHDLGVNKQSPSARCISFGSSVEFFFPRGGLAISGEIWIYKTPAWRKSMKRISVVLSFLIFFAASVGLGQSTGESVQEQAARTIQLVNVDTELQQAIFEKSINVGDPIAVVTLAAAKLNDGTDLVKGSRLEGKVVKAVLPTKKGNSSVVLMFNKVTLPDGKQISVKTVLVHVRIPSNSVVNPQFSVADQGGFTKGGGPAQSLPQVPEGLSSISGDPIFRDMPGLSVTSSYQDMNSGTLTIKGRDWSLPKGSHLEIGLVVLPPDAVLVSK